MRAQIQQIPTDFYNGRQIQLICNQINPIYVEHRFATKKYRKVGKEVREKFLRSIQKGWSIVKVAKKLGINYSTAKSIVQNDKKKRRAQDQDHKDVKISSTDECQSFSFSI